MIWTLPTLDEAFRLAWMAAGEPDERVLADALRKSRHPQHPMKRPDLSRFYYLLADNPRIALVCVGAPLDDDAYWRAGAFFLVGTRLVLGEFEANRPYVGRLGLHMKMQPLPQMTGVADMAFERGDDLLAAISEQLLDQREARRVQREIARKYQWPDQRRARRRR